MYRVWIYTVPGSQGSVLSLSTTVYKTHLGMIICRHVCTWNINYKVEQGLNSP